MKPPRLRREDLRIRWELIAVRGRQVVAVCRLRVQPPYDDIQSGFAQAEARGDWSIASNALRRAKMSAPWE